jgi:peptidyl-prolyl cis-trans isomerase C
MSTTPTKMRCSHILFSWHGAKNSTHTRELAFAVHDAKIILADILKGSITWGIAVREHSACMVTGFETGDLGWFEQHEILPEIWQACLVTEVGQIFPEPVNSPFGVHLIFRTG